MLKHPQWEISPFAAPLAHQLLVDPCVPSAAISRACAVLWSRAGPSWPLATVFVVAEFSERPQADRPRWGRKLWCDAGWPIHKTSPHARCDPSPFPVICHQVYISNLRILLGPDFRANGTWLNSIH